MNDSENPYLPREVVASDKAASGLTVFLMEELGDARLNCQHLKQAIADAQKMIAESSHRDHFYEVAGHLIDGIPKYLFKMEKSLDATALAASRMDYEETKQTLRPEKIEELEDALKDVRVHAPPRQSEPEMTPKEAAARLESIAQFIERTSSLDGALVPMMTLVDGISGRTMKASEPKGIAQLIRQASIEIETSQRPTRAVVAARLREILAAMVPTNPSLVLATILVGSSRDKVIEGFRSANPALTDEQLNEIADQWEKNKDVVKDKHSFDVVQTVGRRIQDRLAALKALVAQSEETLNEYKAARTASTDDDLIVAYNEVLGPVQDEVDHYRSEYEGLRQAWASWDYDYLVKKNVVSKPLLDKLAAANAVDNPYLVAKLASEDARIDEARIPQMKQMFTAADKALVHAWGTEDSGKRLVMIANSLTNIAGGLEVIGLEAEVAPLHRVASHLRRLAPKF